MAILQNRLFWLAVTIVFALVLPWLPFSTDYRVFQFTLVLVYAIAVLGLNILTGYNGQISLGHGAFYAIGGTWRSLARLHMRQKAYPLHVMHHYAMSPSEAMEFCKMVAKRDVRAMTSVAFNSKAK